MDRCDENYLACLSWVVISQLRALDCINLGTPWLYASNPNGYKKKPQSLRKEFCGSAVYKKLLGDVWLPVNDLVYVFAREEVRINQWDVLQSTSCLNVPVCTVLGDVQLPVNHLVYVFTREEIRINQWGVLQSTSCLNIPVCTV